MSIAEFLNVTGAMKRKEETRWFQLPERKVSLNSVRFGHHALVLDSIMRILPLGNDNQSVAALTDRLGNLEPYSAKRSLACLAPRHQLLLALVK